MTQIIATKFDWDQKKNTNIFDFLDDGLQLLESSGLGHFVDEQESLCVADWQTAHRRELQHTSSVQNIHLIVFPINL